VGGEVWEFKCSTSSENVKQPDSGGAGEIIVSVLIDVDKTGLRAEVAVRFIFVPAVASQVIRIK
jgi:hypothetical protein